MKKFLIFFILIMSSLKSEIEYKVRAVKDTFLLHEPVFVEVIVINSEDDVDSFPKVFYLEGELWREDGKRFKYRKSHFYLVGEPKYKWVKIEKGDTAILPLNEYFLQYFYGEGDGFPYYNLPPGKYFFRMKKQLWDPENKKYYFVSSNNTTVFWIVEPRNEKEKKIVYLLSEAKKAHRHFKVKKAITLYEDLLRELRHDTIFYPLILHLLNSLYFGEGELRKVIEISKQIIERFPNSPFAYSHVVALPGEYANLNAYDENEISGYYNYIIQKFPNTRAAKAAEKMLNKIKKGWIPLRLKYRKK